MAGLYGGTVVPTDYSSQPTSFADSISKHFDAMYRNFPNRPKKMSALEAAQTMQIMQNMRLQRDAEFAGKSGAGAGTGEKTAGQQYLGKSLGGGGTTHSSGGHGDGEEKEHPREARSWQAAENEKNRQHEIAKWNAERESKRTGVFNQRPSGLPAQAGGSGMSSSLPTQATPATPIPVYSDMGMDTSTGYTSPGEFGETMPDVNYGGVAGTGDEVPIDFGYNPDYQAAGDAGIPTPVYGDGGGYDPGGGGGDGSTPPGEFGENGGGGYGSTPAADYGGVSTPIPNAAATPDVQATQPDSNVPQDSLGYAKGTKYIEEDQYAKLHEGEAVVPKPLNPAANPDQASTPIGDIIAALPDSKRANEMFAAPANAAGRGLATLGKQAYNDFVQPVVNAVAPTVDRFGRGLALDFPNKPGAPIPTQQAPVQVPPAEIAKNDQIINSAQAAIAKPQMDYATWAKNNPTMAGKGDALLDPAKRDAFLKSTQTTGAAQSVPGGGALPGPIIKDYAPNEQAAAQKDWSNIQKDTRPGGGGMAVHDATGGQIMRTDVLPAPAQQQKAGPSSEKELRAALGQRVLEGWQNGQMNLDETTKALKGLQDYDNSVIKGGLPGVEEKLNMRYEKDKQKAEEAFVRKQEDQVVKDRHDAYKEGMKQWSDASKIEDPHERVDRQMQLNREHFASLLPPEAQDLAKVPVSLDAFIYKSKMLARQKMMENPNDIKSKEYFASLNTPEGKKKAELEWKEMTAKRDSYLRPRR